MAVAVDTTLVGTATGNGVNSITLSNFSTGGTNRLVLVHSDETQDASTVSSVTATGLTFSKVVSVNKASTQGNVETWGAWAASQQTNIAITVNYTGSNFPQAAARTHCFSGTDSTGTVAAAIGATATRGNISSATVAPSQSVTTTRDNSLVICALGSDSNNAFTAGSGQTNDGTTSLGAGNFSEIAGMRQNSATATSGTNVTMNPTIAADSPYGHLVIEILAPVSANSATYSTLSMMGVG